MLGQIVNVTPCDRCHGHGQDRRDAVPHVQGRRPRRAQAQAARDRSRPASTTATRSACRARARPRRAAVCPGNLYVVVHVTPHPELRRRDTELYYDLPLSITQAALGARVTVPDGRRDRGDRDQGGHADRAAEIRLRGKGVPHLRRQGSRGDLHVMVHVRVPQRLTARQRELLEQLAVELGEAEPPGADARRGTGAAATERPSREPRAGAPKARAGRPAARRDQLSAAAVGAADEGLSAAGTWLELSVSADQEAVEQVSEILSRVCPGGVTVEAPFELLDEGLAARLDARAAGHRSRLHRGRRPGRRARRRRGGARQPGPSAGLRAAAASASSRRASSTRRTGPRRGRSTSRSCAWASGS